MPSRHRTLRNTLEWSYSLLSPDEQRLYARLSVFVGGFTLEAAEAVCNTEGDLDILEGLTSLVNNSLLRQEETMDGEPRFGMLETIRSYALERLTEGGQLETLRSAHAQYYGNILLSQAGHGLYTANALHWLNWIEREIDNLRATLHWSLTASEPAGFGAGLVWDLFWFWYRRGYLSEGRLWTKRILTSPVLQKEVAQPRAMALAASGFMAMWQGEQEAGLEQIEDSLGILQRLEDERLMPFLLMGNASTFINMGRDNIAQPLLTEALTLFKEQNQPYFYVVTLVHLGNVELGLGHSEEARTLHEKAQAGAQALSENWLLSFALNNLGEVARTEGHYDLARKYYEKCQALSTRHRRSGRPGALCP